MQGRSRLRIRCCSAGLVLAALIWTVQGHATVVVDIPVEDMALDADGIAMGVVERVGTIVEANGSDMTLVTRVQLRVSRWLKAPRAVEKTLPQTIALYEEGGRLGDWAVMTEGAPTYALGEEVIVFARTVAAPGAAHTATGLAFRTYDLSRGKFLIKRGQQRTWDHVVRDDGDLLLMSWKEREPVLHEGGREPGWQLSAFLAHIERVVAHLPGPTVPGPAAGKEGLQ